MPRYFYLHNNVFYVPSIISLSVRYAGWRLDRICRTGRTTENPYLTSERSISLTPRGIKRIFLLLLIPSINCGEGPELDVKQFHQHSLTHSLTLGNNLKSPTPPTHHHIKWMDLIGDEQRWWCWWWWWFEGPAMFHGGWTEIQEYKCGFLILASADSTGNHHQTVNGGLRNRRSWADIKLEIVNWNEESSIPCWGANLTLQGVELLMKLTDKV